MAIMKQVNQAIKAKYPHLDIQAVRGNGYVYFSGEHGADQVNSIYAHPVNTPTDQMIRMAIQEIEASINDGG